MKRIDRNSGLHDVIDALEGNYDCGRMSNGVGYLIRGNFVHFSGFFDGSQKVVEIPKVPAKIPVLFMGDGFGCSTVAEANAGFVKVPEAVNGKKFVILCDCVLNT